MEVLIFQHHLLCRAAAGGLSMGRTGRSGWVCCRVGGALVAVKALCSYLPATIWSLPVFHSATIQMLALRSLYLEDKLRKDVSLPNVVKLLSVFGLRFQISSKYLNFSCLLLSLSLKGSGKLQSLSIGCLALTPKVCKGKWCDTLIAHCTCINVSKLLHHSNLTHDLSVFFHGTEIPACNTTWGWW